MPARVNPIAELKKGAQTPYKVLPISVQEQTERSNLARARYIRAWDEVVPPIVAAQFDQREWRAIGSGKSWVGLVSFTPTSTHDVLLSVEIALAGAATLSAARNAARRSRFNVLSGAGDITFLRWVLHEIQKKQAELQRLQPYLGVPVGLTIWASDAKRARAYTYLERLGFKRDASRHNFWEWTYPQNFALRNNSAALPVRPEFVTACEICRDIIYYPATMKRAPSFCSPDCEQKGRAAKIAWQLLYAQRHSAL